MDTSEKVYRMGVWRRAGYPAAVVVVAAGALVKWCVTGDPMMLRACAFSLLAAALVFWYLGQIRLVINPLGITLRWPFRKDISVAWNSVVQVRRSEAASASHFFVDLIESADKSLQFNPYYFENPSEIIQLLNKYLDSDLFMKDGALVDGLGIGVAVKTEAEAAPAILRPQGFLLIVVIVAILLLIYYKLF